MELQTIAPPQDHPFLHSHYNKPLTQPTDKISTHRHVHGAESLQRLGRVQLCMGCPCRNMYFPLHQQGADQEGAKGIAAKTPPTCTLLLTMATLEQLHSNKTLPHWAPQHVHSWSSSASGNLANHLVKLCENMKQKDRVFLPCTGQPKNYTLGWNHI